MGLSNFSAGKVCSYFCFHSHVSFSPDHILINTSPLKVQWGSAQPWGKVKLEDRRWRVHRPCLWHSWMVLWMKACNSLYFSRKLSWNWLACSALIPRISDRRSRPATQIKTRTQQSKSIIGGIYSQNKRQRCSSGYIKNIAKSKSFQTQSNVYL